MVSFLAVVALKNIAGTCTNTALDTSFSSSHYEPFYIWLFAVVYYISSNSRIAFVAKTQLCCLKGVFTHVWSFHLCIAVEYQPYHLLLNCYFTPREVLASFENNLDVFLCCDRDSVCVRSDWWPLFLEINKAIYMPRYSTRSSFSLQKVLQTWGELGNLYFGEGAALCGSFSYGSVVYWGGTCLSELCPG